MLIVDTEIGWHKPRDAILDSISEQIQLSFSIRVLEDSTAGNDNVDAFRRINKSLWLREIALNDFATSTLDFIDKVFCLLNIGL